MSEQTQVVAVKLWERGADRRVYVHMSDGREGCLFLTGNERTPARTVVGQVKPIEWNAARVVAGAEHSENWRPYGTPLARQQSAGLGPRGHGRPLRCSRGARCGICAWCRQGKRGRS